LLQDLKISEVKCFRVKDFISVPYSHEDHCKLNTFRNWRIKPWCPVLLIKSFATSMQ
jgi:hypothetical protein